jgi:hypothetical protein
MGERVRFQAVAMLHNEIKELERRASLVARYKALISAVGSGLWLLKNG